ncbi:MAG: hypothetical protein LBQ71_21480 [Hungatella sp.]|jgi:hypothetical protein|nr:hypothetical protein [Hungatella sp.]
MADLKDTYVVYGAWTTCTCGMRKSRTVLEKSHGVFLKDTAAEAQKIKMAVEKNCPNTFTDTVMNFFTKKRSERKFRCSITGGRYLHP